jgi:hypothetical protein
VGHMLRSSNLLHCKASQARVSQFASKLAEEQRCVVHVASSHRSREDECNTPCFSSPNLSLITIISSLVMHYVPELFN